LARPRKWQARSAQSLKFSCAVLLNMNASTVSCAPPSHSVLSSIRRLVEPYTPGFDVWSLVQLLEDMRRAAEAFGRSEIESLFDASDAPSYEGPSRGAGC
jgi:hypothetical protein